MERYLENTRRRSAKIYYHFVNNPGHFNPKPKKIILFDTEVSPWQVSNDKNNICFLFHFQNKLLWWHMYIVWVHSIHSLLKVAQWRIGGASVAPPRYSRVRDETVRGLRFVDAYCCCLYHDGLNVYGSC